MNYSARQRLLEQELARLGLDALLITHLANIRYLCGFSSPTDVIPNKPKCK
jgi:Xaa-Pro aminopeptidase